MPEQLHKHDGERRIASLRYSRGRPSGADRKPANIPTTRGIWKRPQSWIGSQSWLRAFHLLLSIPSSSFMRTTRAKNLARSCARSASTLIPRLLRTSAGATSPVELAGGVADQRGAERSGFARRLPLATLNHAMIRFVPLCSILTSSSQGCSRAHGGLAPHQSAATEQLSSQRCKHLSQVTEMPNDGRAVRLAMRRIQSIARSNFAGRHPVPSVALST